MPGHFDSIGFVADDEGELTPFVERALREGDQLEVLGADSRLGRAVRLLEPRRRGADLGQRR